MTAVPAPIEADPSTFLSGLHADLWLEGDDVHLRMEVQPSHLRPGTDQFRLGLLATIVDIVGGAPSFGILNPTLDLRVTLGDRAPSSGTIEFVCRPVRVGRRLYVSETLAHTGDESAPFLRGVSTFVNRVIPEHTHEELIPPGSHELPSYDALHEIREPAPGVFEVDNHALVGNVHTGTMLGGAQALLAEMLAERTLERADGHGYEAFDLDIRYLDALRTPTMRARTATLPGALDHRCVRVAMVEADADERTVSLATLLCRPGA